MPRSKVIKRTSYSVKMKREVVNYAKQHGKSVAASHFKVNISMIGRWIKASMNWTTETNGKKRKLAWVEKLYTLNLKKYCITGLLSSVSKGWPSLIYVYKIK